MDILPTYLKPIHMYAYKKENGELPKITGLKRLIPEPYSPSRLCYELTYSDGDIDYVPITDVEEGKYQIVS